MSKPQHFADWEPMDGATVHLSPRNRWQLPAGRYLVDSWQGCAWQLRCIRSGKRQAVYAPDLVDEARRGPLTPISAAELERERQTVALRKTWEHVELGRARQRAEDAIRGAVRAAIEGKLI